MRDYVYPSVYFAYFYFFLLLCGALYFCFRTRKDGYWGREAEEAKYRMLQDDDEFLSVSDHRSSTLPGKKPNEKEDQQHP